MESILTSIKKLLGVDELYEHFDIDIIIDINSVFMILTQLGIGPPEGFYISSKEQTWADFIGDRKDIEAVKTYVYLRTRLIFDPPQSGFLIDAIKNLYSEIEWRLVSKVEGETIPV